MDRSTVQTAATTRLERCASKVIIPPGALTRDGQKQLVKELTNIVAKVSEDQTLSSRTWVLLSEAAEGAYDKQEFADLAAKAAAARAK